MINLKSTLNIIFEYSNPIREYFEYLDEVNQKTIGYNIFNKFINNQIEKSIKQKENNQNIVKIKEAYSIRNLSTLGLIIKDEGLEKFHFKEHYSKVFKDYIDYSNTNPITSEKFIEHNESLISILEKSSKFYTMKKFQKETFIEIIQNKLTDIFEDFEENRIIILKKTDNLSKLLEANESEYQTKNKIRDEIIDLSEKYIEPFFNFISETHNKKNGYIENLREISNFFEKLGNDFIEEQSKITRFLISRQSYLKDIQKVFLKINEYKRKNKENLIVFNAFEKAFIDLDNTIKDMLNGKRNNSYLSSNDYINKFSNINNIKHNFINKNETSINFQYFCQNFERIEEEILSIESSEASQLSEEKQQKINEIIEKNKIKNLELRKEKQINHKNKFMIKKLITKNKRKILENNEKDIISKIDFILKEEIENYQPFYSLYGLNIILKEEKHFFIKWNEDKFIQHEESQYKHKAIYFKEKTNEQC